MEDLEGVLGHIQPIVHEAGEFIRNHYGQTANSDIEIKEARSLVTFVDKGAEKILVNGLSKLLPEATFITEEDVTKNQKSQLMWIVDPLDGTTNFLHGIPFFSVSVALRTDQKTLIGVVYDVVHQEYFEAIDQSGATLNGQSIQVKSETDFSDAIIATGFPYDKDDKSDAYVRVLQHVIKKTRGVRRLGSAALDLSNVAAGRLDGYYEYNLNAWDVAAGNLLVQESGGTVEGFFDTDDWLNGDSLIAGHPKLVSQLREIIQFYL